MKCFKLTLIASIISLATNAQTENRETPPPPIPEMKTSYPADAENRIFDKVEVEATFPGGDKGWRQYMEKSLNANVPVDNGAPAGKYTVVVQFIVDKKGHPYDIRSLTNHGYGMEEEVIRVIKKGPNWIPAVQNGRPVNAYKRQPVTFLVENDFDISLTEFTAGKETEITINYDLQEGQSLEPSVTGGTIRRIEGKKFMIKVDKPGKATLVVQVKGRKGLSHVGSFLLEIK